MGSTFEPTQQLENILTNWTPNDRVEIIGVVLDYIERSGANLCDVFKLNRGIYEEIFYNQSKEDREALLKSSIRDQTDFDGLKAACEGSFPAVAQAMAGLPEFIQGKGRRAELSKPTERLFDLLKPAAGRTIIWQVSDIHFGCFNVWLNDAKELAAALGHAVGLLGGAKPSYVICSGDVASTGAEEEFRAFGDFCEALGIQLWGKACPQRIISVPGNHDASWLNGGKADRLASFQKHVANRGVCITPFGNPVETFSEPAVEVVRSVGQDDCPPFASVRLVDEGIELILLVSAFFSGEVPDAFIQLVKRSTADPTTLKALLDYGRQDVGRISMAYLSLLANTLNVREPIAIAVTHHHLVQYGAEVNQNRHAFAMLRTLFDKGIKVVLHGHLHLFEEDEELRGSLPGLAYCVPCSTIASNTAQRSRGFMIHVVDRNEGKIVTFTWELSGAGYFSKDLLRPAYSFEIGGEAFDIRRFTGRK